MHSHRNAVDVIVVGGGPAGAGSATWLAQAGFQVVLLDRAHFPRDKACGEFLTREARRLMVELGAWERVVAAGARSVSATVLCASGGAQTRHIPADGGPTGYSLRRIALDAALLETARAAGVEVREGFAVRELRRMVQSNTIGVTGKEDTGTPFTLSARLVIGADGAHSLVARQLGLVRALPRLQRVALVSHWQRVSGDNAAIEMRAHGQIVCGVGFPDADAANVTLVVPTGLASQIAGRAAEFCEETIQTHFPDLAARLSGAVREQVLRTVGCFGHVCTPPVADGALLVGDAATFIDPFTGEGVYFGLRGAQLAAEVAADALYNGDTSRTRLLAYHRARQELTRRYLLCDVVQAVVRRPVRFAQIVRRLERFPGLADRLLGILSDTRPPTDALHPAFLWRLLAPELGL
jgi:geranylgeranyl reductase family protein